MWDEVDAEVWTGRMCQTWHSCSSLSRRMGEAESWRCIQHDLQIEFAGAEATHLLVYMACQKGSLAWAQGSTRCQGQHRKGH